MRKVVAVFATVCLVVLQVCPVGFASDNQPPPEGTIPQDGSGASSPYDATSSGTTSGEALPGDPHMGHYMSSAVSGDSLESTSPPVAVAGDEDTLITGSLPGAGSGSTYSLVRNPHIAYSQTFPPGQNQSDALAGWTTNITGDHQHLLTNGNLTLRSHRGTRAASRNITIGSEGGNVSLYWATQGYYSIGTFTVTNNATGETVYSSSMQAREGVSGGFDVNPCGGNNAPCENVDLDLNAGQYTLSWNVAGGGGTGRTGLTIDNVQVTNRIGGILPDGPINDIPANLALNSDGTYAYTPPENFHGTVQFSYVTSDGQTTSDPETVTITVNPTNDAPTAPPRQMRRVNYVDLAAGGGSFTGSLGTEDIDGDTLTYSFVGTPPTGVVLNADGTFTLTPAANFQGQIRFQYQVSDGSLTATGRVFLFVNSVNDAPVATNVSSQANLGGQLQSNVTATDPDIGGFLNIFGEGTSLPALTYSLVGEAPAGLTFNNDGTYTYAPPAGFSGDVTFSYKANDGELDSNVATVTLEVRLRQNYLYQLQYNDYADAQAYINALSQSDYEAVVMDYSFYGDEDNVFTPAQIQQVINSGTTPISYISIGEASIFRAHWNDAWVNGEWDWDNSQWVNGDGSLTPVAPSWLGEWNPEWPESRKVRFWDPDWFTTAVQPWLDSIIDADFQGVYLDIIDAYQYWGDPATYGTDGETRIEGDPANEEEAAQRMIAFVQQIADYCRTQTGNPNFRVVPQNGAGIIEYDTGFNYNGTNHPAGGYLNTVSGIGVESVWYTETTANDPTEVEYRLDYLRQFRDAGLPVWVTDYVDDGSGYTGANRQRIDAFASLAEGEGFTYYVARSNRDLANMNFIQEPPPLPAPPSTPAPTDASEPMSYGPMAPAPEPPPVPLAATLQPLVPTGFSVPDGVMTTATALQEELGDDYAVIVTAAFGFPEFFWVSAYKRDSYNVPESVGDDRYYRPFWAGGAPTSTGLVNVKVYLNADGEIVPGGVSARYTSPGNSYILGSDVYTQRGQGTLLFAQIQDTVRRSNPGATDIDVLAEMTRATIARVGRSYQVTYDGITEDLWTSIPEPAPEPEPEPVPPAPVAFSWDLNDDGNLDAWDTNQDGNPDTWDANFDGVGDAYDTTGDGQANMWDTTGDGQVDMWDTNNDGVADSYDTTGTGGGMDAEPSLPVPACTGPECEMVPEEVVVATLELEPAPSPASAPAVLQSSLVLEVISLSHALAFIQGEASVPEEALTMIQRASAETVFTRATIGDVVLVGWENAMGDRFYVLEKTATAVIFTVIPLPSDGIDGGEMPVDSMVPAYLLNLIRLHQQVIRMQISPLSPLTLRPRRQTPTPIPLKPKAPTAPVSSKSPMVRPLKPSLAVANNLAQQLRDYFEAEGLSNFTVITGYDLARGGGRHWVRIANTSEERGDLKAATVSFNSEGEIIGMGGLIKDYGPIIGRLLFEGLKANETGDERTRTLNAMIKLSKVVVSDVENGVVSFQMDGVNYRANRDADMNAILEEVPPVRLERGVAHNGWKFEFGPGGPNPNLIDLGNGVLVPELQIYRQDGENFFQIASINGNGYLRSVLPPSPGRSDDWGTSWVTPGWWDEGDNYHHNMRITRAWIEEGPDDSIVLKGEMMDETGSIVARDLEIQFPPYQRNQEGVATAVEMDVSFTLEAATTVAISPDRYRNGEGFRIAQWSSMYIDPTTHDADQVLIKNLDETWTSTNLRNDSNLLFSGPQSVSAGEIVLSNTNPTRGAPSTKITILEPDPNSLPVAAQFYTNRTFNPNDDNVGGWLQPQNLQSSYGPGERIGKFHYVLEVTSPYPQLD